MDFEATTTTDEAVFLFRELVTHLGNFTELMWLHIVQSDHITVKSWPIKVKYARFMRNIIISIFCFLHGFRQHFSPGDTLKKSTIIPLVSIYEYAINGLVVEYSLKKCELINLHVSDSFNSW